MSNRCKGSIDRISALPDPLLQHILSFLEVQDFIKTSVLSKRWRFVWAGVPVLRFSDDTTPHFVTETLANYSGNKLKVLFISTHHTSPVDEWIDEWIRFATERKVEELYHHVSEVQHPVLDFCQLPQSIYSNSSLRILALNRLFFEPIVSVSWTSLKKLDLYNAKLSNDAFASILLGSPSLEHLTMKFFEGMDKITITSSNLKLKDLVLWAWKTDNAEISAPHINSLMLLHFDTERGTDFKLINLSSLVNLDLLFYGNNEAMIVMVGELPRLQNLRVTSASVELLSRGQMLSSPTPLLLLKCEFLELNTSCWKWDFHRIVTLLRSTPSLSQLSIFMSFPDRYEFDNNSQYWESLKADVKCDHLRKVLIDGFNPSRCVGTRLKFFTSVVEFLLKNAKALEEMTILIDSNEALAIDKLRDLPEVKKLISSYPTASVVVFKACSKYRFIS